MRCYRLSLPLTEVKDCVQAAKKGIAYDPKQTDGDSSLRREPAGSESKTDASKDSHQKALTPTGRVIERDLEDLTLTQQLTKKGAAPVLEQPVVGPSLHALLGRINKLQALILWLLVVLAFLAIVPRIARLQRRARSGMRTE